MRMPSTQRDLAPRATKQDRSNQSAQVTVAGNQTRSIKPIGPGNRSRKKRSKESTGSCQSTGCGSTSSNREACARIKAVPHDVACYRHNSQHHTMPRAKLDVDVKESTREQQSVTVPADVVHLSRKKQNCRQKESKNRFY
jgi:hypothetical protein